ncbi:DNA recombination protein RmuC [Halomonas lysinitropha]|uniref:DNA recombination protein RmuC n=1 Tax=Halomonas lysinitropha TaxID=2607506 RepID=A0A5K1IA86_9GAMM|nr:DNA recombination protein RmuC [Halomonas lysinitropha]VVZ94799.1 DNA recombination protein RmuC [Halomonas lysinitropha]
MNELLQGTAPAWLATGLAGLLVVMAWAGLSWRRRLVAAEARLFFREQALAEGEATVRRLEQELAQSDAQLDGSRERLATLEAELADTRDRLAERREHAARLETEREQMALRQREQLALMEEARERLKEEFQQLAGRIFEERQQAFSVQSRDSLEATLRPFREQVDQFRRRVEELHGQQSRDSGSLKAHLEQLAGLNARLGDEAAGLARALKGDQKAQGHWGELMLETVLERSGLRRDIEYRREVSLQGDQGRQRPDAVIYLPDDRHLIIDAKVSLVAWTRVVNAEDEAEREAAMKAHLQSLRGHVAGLSGKDYPSLPGLNSPDFVFLFVPVEPAFAAAFERDPTLFQEAFDRQVVVVTPTTLLASLRTVAGLWSLERQNENARLIGDRAEKLLAKFSGFVESLEEVGRHLERAGDSHRRAMARLSSGQGSLVAQATELQRLGVRMKKPLPTELVRAAGEEGEPDDEGTGPF